MMMFGGSPIIVIAPPRLLNSAWQRCANIDLCCHNPFNNQQAPNFTDHS